MSMKIKVTVPSVELIQADSAVRRSLFKILECGGTISENDMMEVWRNLGGTVRCEWAVRMAQTVQLRPAHIQELQEQHKRSTKLRSYLLTSQKSLSDEEVNSMFTEWSKVVEKAFDRQLGTRWPMYGPGSTKLRRFTLSLLKNNRHYIDRLDEQTLYNLSASVASHVSLIDKELGRVSRSAPWWTREYIKMLGRGTRNSVLVPLLASTNEDISKWAGDAYAKVAIHNLDS